MKKSNLHTALILVVVVSLACLVGVQVTGNAATITDGHPGYPNQWDGLTTNTIIEISLDEPVALIGGDPTVPDIDYCVKKATFSGLDFVFSDVTCEIEVSADRKTLKLYPTDLLGENDLYAYKVNNINFEGGGSQQDVAAYFATGDNPIPTLALQVDEADMCGDQEDKDLEQLQYYCGRCHFKWIELYPSVFPCVITP
jgi:hypothetical protein